MVDAGLTNILIANQVVGPTKVGACAHRRHGPGHRGCRASGNANELSKAAVRADLGSMCWWRSTLALHRAGVRSQDERWPSARHVAKPAGPAASGRAGIRRPHTCWSRIGWCRSRRPWRQWKILIALAILPLSGRASIPRSSRRAASGTWDITPVPTADHRNSCGSYIFNDAFHRNPDAGFGNRPATVAATVTSIRHRRQRRRRLLRAKVDRHRDRAVPDRTNAIKSGSWRIRYPRGTCRADITVARPQLHGRRSRVRLIPGYSPDHGQPV